MVKKLRKVNILEMFFVVANALQLISGRRIIAEKDKHIVINGVCY